MKEIPAFLNISKLAGVFCIPLLFGVVTIKLVPQVTVLTYLLLLIGLLAYPIAQWRQKKGWKAVLGGFGVSLIVSLLSVFILRTIIFEPRYLVGTAMMPTVEPGTRLVGDKTSYWLHTPQRGDVILFQPDQREGRAIAQISRVIGLPGEMVDIKAGAIWINQKLLDEPYVKMTAPSDITFDPFRVKKRHYFVLSDNRGEVLDAPDAHPHLSQEPRKAVNALIKARMLSWRPLS